MTTAMQFIRDNGDLPPQIEQEAANLYRHAMKEGIVTGRSIRGVTAACVYIAARQAEIPRRIEVIAKAFDMVTEVEEKEQDIQVKRVLKFLFPKFKPQYCGMLFLILELYPLDKVPEIH